MPSFHRRSCGSGLTRSSMAFRVERVECDVRCFVTFRSTRRKRRAERRNAVCGHIGRGESMRSKNLKGVRATLQEFKVIPITDPVEQAALDRRIAEADKVLAERGETKKSKP